MLRITLCKQKSSICKPLESTHMSQHIVLWCQVVHIIQITRSILYGRADMFLALCPCFAGVMGAIMTLVVLVH